jgi:hypothetical protein
MTWNDRFLSLFDRCTALYQSGNRDFESYYTGEDLAFLSTIGYRRREFFDFIEDFCEENEPTPSTALLIAAARRDYFLVIQKGITSTRQITRDELPTFGDTLDGFTYLPRILAKARAKLRGELDPDIMYGCGGDRAFLARNASLHPADFLRIVWAAGDDDQAVVKAIRNHTS